MADRAVEHARDLDNPLAQRSAFRRGEHLVDAVAPFKFHQNLTGAALLRECAVIEAAKIPLPTISGGGNPSIQATAKKAAELGGGLHVLIRTKHHFPQPVLNAFNEVFEAFMEACGAAD